MHELTVPLQSHGNHRFLCRVNSVIGIGVGAGAYILSRFAVSSIRISTSTFSTPFISLISSPPLLSVLPVIIEGFQATQPVTPNIKASRRAHTGQQVSPQSAADAAIPQMMNHLGDSLPSSLAYVLLLHSTQRN